jgi:sec-independent protein translocase protein TatB
MIDFGFDKLALIGAVALIVIGPEKLPKVARTVGHRSIELDELKKMKTQFEDAARNVEQSVNQELHETSRDLEQSWNQATGFGGSAGELGGSTADLLVPQYQHPRKNWRLKRGATPLWYKQRHGVRTRAQSGAARVARFRPPRASS